MTFWLPLLLGSCGLLLADLLIHVVYAHAALHRFETLPTFRVLPPPQNSPEPQLVEFATTDNLHLRGGIYFPQQEPLRGVILFCPETGGGFETVMNYAAALVEAGYAVVSFSFRNQSPSDSMEGYRSNYWLSRYEVEDVHAALDFIESEPQFHGLSVGLMGVSRGAGAALAGGGIRPEVQRIWTQGGFSSRALAMHHAMKFIRVMIGPFARLIPEWHVRVTIWFMLRLSEFRNHCQLVTLESYLPHWQGREVMFISGARDTYVPPQLSSEMCLQTHHSPETSQWVVPQAKHNLERATAPAEFDERLVSFFSGMEARELPIRPRKSALAR